MEKKPAKIAQLLNNKCPVCGKGDLWPSKNPYVCFFTNGGNSNKSCSECNHTFEKGPGYWYGAMYASYAIGVGIFVAFWVLSAMFLPEETPVWQQLAIILSAIVILAPINYYYSRLMWLYISNGQKIEKT